MMLSHCWGRDLVYWVSHDQTRYVAKEVRRALAIERPTSRTRAVARPSREEERRLIVHAYRVQGTPGLFIKTLFQTGARLGLRKHQSG